MASKRRLRDWGRPAARSAEVSAAVRADPEPPKRPPGRKDTRSWCRGKHGVPHQPVIVFRPPVFGKGNTITNCEWAHWGTLEEVFWRCHHEEHCENCGRILRSSVTVAECPDYPGSAEQRAAAEADLERSRERWDALRARRRKPAITGPQGYRRRRD